MKIITKKAEKGSIVTIMSQKFYWDMCKKHLNITEFYENVMFNTKTILEEKVDDFIRKYKEVLTDKEYEYFKSFNYKIAWFYLLPKLHRSQRLNDIIAQNTLEYIKISEVLDIEGRPIAAGSAYRIHGISILTPKIMQPRLEELYTY